MDTLVDVHGLLRWVVLAAAVAALAVGLMGWIGSGTSEKLGRQVMLAYAVVLDVQVLVGAVIWVAERRWAGGGRLFQLEHPIIMLLALAIAHVAAARARRSSAPIEAARVRTIGAAVSLGLILVGIPWQR
jgi:hypothetical protein